MNNKSSLSPIDRDLYRTAVRTLAAVCDGAYEHDQKGFNAVDTHIGHELAAKNDGLWTPFDYWTAYQILQKYRNQLNDMGIVLNGAAVPTDKRQNMLHFANGLFQVHFPYSSNAVNEFKTMFPNWKMRQFVRTEPKHWTVLSADVENLRKAAENPDYFVTEAAKEALKNLGEPQEVAEAEHIIKFKDGFFVFLVEYDRELTDEIRSISGRKAVWDKTGPKDTFKYWSVPLSAAEQVASVANQFAIPFSKAAKTAVNKHLGDVQVLTDLSSAENATIGQIEGLKGELRPFQKAGVAYATKAKRTFIADQMGLGKAQPLSAKILTPNGWTCMKDIRLGDYVIGSDGKPTHVTGVYPQGEREIYKVTFSDGYSTECCKEHLWQVNSPSRKWRGDSPRVISLQDIMDRGLKHSNGNRQHFIPLVSSVEFVENDLPLDPYLVGALLGDGGLTTNTPMFSSADQEVLKNIQSALPKNVTLKHNNKYDYYLSGTDSQYQENPLTAILRSLNMMGKYSYEKEIPEIYKFSTINSRIALLQGLMDTDGWVNIGKRGNAVQFCSSSEKLTDDIVFITQSLGGVAKKKYKSNKKRGAWIITLSLPNNIPPFRLSRKAKLVTQRTKYQPSRSIDSITYVGKKPAQCISVDAKNNLYVTDNFIVTHNTVQTLASLLHLEAFPAHVICPATLKENWRNEVRKWLPDELTVEILYGSNGSHTADVTILNYDILGKHKRQILARGAKYFVFDESHMLKNRKAARSKHAEEICKTAEVVLMLTGTAIKSRHNELIQQLKIMRRLDDFGGFWHFANRYCNAHQGRFGLDLTNSINGQELNAKLRQLCYIRRLKKDVLKELPDKTYTRVYLEIDNRKEYDKAAENFLAHLGPEWAEKIKSRAITPEFLESIAHLPTKEQRRLISAKRFEAYQRAVQAEALIAINGLKQLAWKGKKAAVMEWFDNFRESGEPMVVFAEHTDTIKQMAKWYQAPTITGQTPNGQRQTAVDEFQNGNVDMIVGNHIAMGVGLTLTKASNLAMVQFPWTPADMAQAEDRIHRIGQENAANIWQLVAKDTVEEQILDLLAKKQAILDAALDGKEISADDDSVLNDLIRILKK